MITTIKDKEEYIKLIHIVGNLMLDNSKILYRKFEKIKEIQEYKENLTSRNIFYKNIFIENYNDISNITESINKDLDGLRNTCYTELEKIAKYLLKEDNNINENYIIENKKNANKLLLEIDKSKKIKKENKELLNANITINANIREFIHQIKNIISMIKPVIVNKVLQKEQTQNKILRDNDFLFQKLMNCQEQISRVQREVNMILHFKTDKEVIDKEIIHISKIEDFFDTYKNRLESFEFYNKTFNIPLVVENTIKDAKLVNYKDKICEVIDVILNNGAEELCNKKIEEIKNKVNLSPIELSVHIYKDEKDFIIRIKDNGRGIKDKDKIFEPYYTTKDKYGGSGIGLATAKDILNDIQGFIQVNTKINKGTTFYFKFQNIKDNQLFNNNIKIKKG